VTTPTSDGVQPMLPASFSRPRVLYYALAVLLLPFLAINLNFPHSFTGYSIAAAFVLHVMARHRPREWLAAALVGLVLNQSARLVASLFHMPGKAPIVSFAMLGAGSLIVLGWPAVWKRVADASNLQNIYLPSVVLVALVLISQLMLLVTPIRRVETFDVYLQMFDLSLVWPPVFALGRIFQRVNDARSIALNTYLFLPIVVAVVCGGYIRFRKASAWATLKVMAIAGLLGYATYLLFPAAGPEYVPAFNFPTGFFSLADIHTGYSRALLPPVAAARNAMPSLHLAWALLLWFESKALARVFRLLTFVYVVLTIIVVLGLGEHYIADLVVAVPFSVLVLAICSSTTTSASTRRKASLGSTLMVSGWLALLRYGTALFVLSPILPWTMTIVSTAVSAILVSPLLGTANDPNNHDMHQAEVSMPESTVNNRL